MESTGCRQIDDLNIKLRDHYGLDIGSGNQKFRIVWTSHQRETRHGKFVDLSSEGYFLREVIETRNTEKYPFNPEAWVLERLQGNDNNPELVARISYEPIWIYGAVNSDPNPDWEHTVVLVHTALYVENRKALTDSDLREIEDKKFLKEKAHFKTMIQNDSEYLVGALVAGAAVSLPKRTDKE